MKFCLNCGEKLPEKARFCPNCGVAIEKTEKLTRAEMYKDRELDVDDLDDHVEDVHNEPDEEANTTTSSRRSKNQSSGWKVVIDYLKIFGKWLKNNPLSALIALVIVVLVYVFLSKMVGIVLFILAVICGVFYAKRVGADNRNADLGIKKRFGQIKGKIDDLSKKSTSKRPKPTDQRVNEEVITTERPQNDVDVTPKQTAKKNKRRGSFKGNLLIFAALVLIVTTYIGPFASAAVAGYSTPTTLMSILKSLNHTSILLELLVGPVLLVVGVLIRSRIITKFGSIINIVGYGYTFFVIYQNEARTSGMTGMFNNVNLGMSGYLAVGISIMILVLGVGSRKRNQNKNIEA